MQNAVRWQQKLENFARAFPLFQEVLGKDMLHTYDHAIFEMVFRNISEHYVVALEQVFTWLNQRKST